MNLSEKILKFAQAIATTNEKLDVPKVVTVAVLTGGIIWGCVTYIGKDVTKNEKVDVCSDIQERIDAPGSLADKVELLQASQELGCK